MTHPSSSLCHVSRAALGLAIVATLSACDLFAGGPPEKLSAEQQARVDALVNKTLEQLSHIPGGGFWLGDPGVLMTEELKASGAVLGPHAKISGNPGYTIGEGNKPPRWVTLDAFSIGQYKVTYGDFDVYVEVNGLPAHPPDGDAETWQRIWQRAR